MFSKSVAVHVISRHVAMCASSVVANDEERVFHEQRPVLTTSINDVAVRSDLDRKSVV